MAEQMAPDLSTNKFPKLPEAKCPPAKRPQRRVSVVGAAQGDRHKWADCVEKPLGIFAEF